LPIEAGRAGKRAARVGAAVLLGIVVAATATTPGADAAAADAERGESVFRKACAVCHAVAAGHHKEGPSLHGVFGRPAGSAPSFRRYKGLRGVDLVWDEETLDRWLADPRGFLGGGDSSMTFKLERAQDRADVIAYLKTIR
jgi:cytochrome c